MSHDTTLSPTATAELPRAQSLVDCDLHPLVADVRELAARMSKRAARRVDVSGHIGGAAREPNRALHPTGPLRLDAIPPSGGPPGSDPVFAKETWLDRFGVTAALLVPIQAAAVISWSDEAAVSEYLSALNDHLLERWVGLDERFRLAISVSPHDGRTAVREIERLADTPGVAAVNIPLAEVSPSRPGFFDIYEIAADRGLPVLLHPTGAEGNLHNAPTFAGGMVRSYPEHHAMLAHSGQAAAAAIVLSGALARFPDLKVVFAEFGFSWVAPLMWRMDDAWQRGGEALGLDRPPSSYLLDQMRFTTQPMDEPENGRELWRLFDAMEAHRTLLFSSDYPHWDADDPSVIFKTRLPEHLRDRVAFANAVECFAARLG